MKKEEFIQMFVDAGVDIAGINTAKQITKLENIGFKKGNHRLRNYLTILFGNINMKKEYRCSRCKDLDEVYKDYCVQFSRHSFEYNKKGDYTAKTIKELKDAETD
jgi:hypothetical protein